MSGPVNVDTVLFDAPQAFTDGSTLPAGAIARYEYGFSQTAGGPYTKIVPDTDLTPNPQGKQTADIDLSGFAFGQWYAAARAVTSTQYGSVASAWSNEFAFEVQAKTPQAPRNFSIG
jgi:hypothetical protein